MARSTIFCEFFLHFSGSCSSISVQRRTVQTPICITATRTPNTVSFSFSLRSCKLFLACFHIQLFVWLLYKLKISALSTGGRTFNSTKNRSKNKCIQMCGKQWYQWQAYIKNATVLHPFPVSLPFFFFLNAHLFYLL